MIRTLLVANRAEVASRVFRTARSLGIHTVAVHSTADAGLPFVREADVAVCIGPAAAADSYLNIPALLAAAERTGADAIHPGYGFLAERADFAEAVLAAGLTWVGPAPEVIRAMGDKAAARRLAVKNGVAVVPGYDGTDQSVAVFEEEAAAIGFPVLLKAAAGGGGRGMRIVRSREALADAHASARREATSAFGDPTLLLEKLIERPRHIEVQVFGDGRGNVVHLFERECSIQRRHQKVVEEAPAPNLAPDVREALTAASVRLAAAVNYAGAGTVEFIVGEDGTWAFLEMNTRLQVEHEVTECITGTDLVAWQLQIAEGGALPLEQHQIVPTGSAIEVRIYAEDPQRDWMPTHGELLTFALHGDRLSSSFSAGDTVSVHYDSMLAKVVCTGATRAVATRKLARALDRAWIGGLTTNLPLLRQIASDDAFVAGHTTTAFLTERGLPRPPPIHLDLTLLGAGLWSALRTRSQARFPPGVPLNFRVGGPAAETELWRVGSDEHKTEVCWVSNDTVQLAFGTTSERVTLLHHTAGTARIVRDGVQQTWRLHRAGAQVFIHDGQREGMAVHLPRFPLPEPPAPEPGSCVAPTPGTVRVVDTAVGDVVEAGQTLVVLEAMKMEHAVRAPAAGTVRQVRCAVGDAVDAGDILVRLEPVEAH